MKPAEMHWAVFGLLMVVSVAIGMVIADTYLEKRFEKRMQKNG